MTRARRSFRHPSLVVAFWMLGSCSGRTPPMEPPTGEGGAGGEPAPTGEGGAGGQVSDASSVFFVDRPPDLSPDRPPDVPPTPRDAAPPSDGPPPLEPGVVLATSCFQIPCQGLFVAAAACMGDDQMCQSQSVTEGLEGEVVRTNYCLANGVKKHAVSTSTELEYKTTMRVTDASGRHCYTLEVVGADSNDLETLTWRSPAGFSLLSGTWSKSGDRMLLACNGVKYDVRDLGCPGLEGEPGTTSCPPGLCPD